MTTLADEIASLRTRLAEQYEAEMFAAAKLAAQVAAHRDALAVEIGRLVDEHERGRVALLEQLVTLARRVGHLPGPVYRTPLPAGLGAVVHDLVPGPQIPSREAAE